MDPAELRISESLHLRQLDTCMFMKRFPLALYTDEYLTQRVADGSRFWCETECARS